jgi:hypothetical protein
MIKFITLLPRGWRSLVGAGILLVLSIGCTSTKTLWNSRIGVYTFDQAVMEWGPPDKAATLTDGTIVAEWLTRRGSPGGFGSPYYAYPPIYHRHHHYYWSPPLYYYDPPSPDFFMRLTFGPDGLLRAWQRMAH